MRRSIGFVVVFWGKKFRDQFLDYCLASLLAPNNLAAFSEPGLPPIDVRLIICSTADDFQAVSQTSLFHLLESLARVEFIDIGLPRPDRHPILHMSLGHKRGLWNIVQAKSYGGFLAPDIVLADGSLRTLARHIRMGTRTVLAPALRFDFVSVVGQLDRAGVLKPDQPLTIAPRALARIAATSLHSELKRFEYDEDHFCDEPISTIFTAPGTGLIVHTSSWAIAAADFADLPPIDDSIFDDDTVDAHFINDNLVSSEPVLLDDSDEYLMMPITTEEDYPAADCLIPDPYLAGRPEALKDERKITFIRTFLFSPHSDQSRRWASRRPVYIHYRHLPEGSNPVVTRSVALIERALATAPLARPVYFFVAFRSEPLRSAFVNNLLSSLMAPSNAPALAGGEGNRLFIACSETDKAAVMAVSWLMHRIPSFMTFEFMDIGEAGADDADRRLLDARNLVAARSIKENAYLSVLDPNLLLSDGTLARVIGLAKSGHEAVLAYAFPVSAGPLEARLLASQIKVVPHPRTGQRAVQLSARSLARHALAFRHPSLYHQEWDGAWAAERPLGILHRSPGGFVVQTTEWTVLLIDLGAVAGFGSDDVPDDFLERALAELHGRGRVHCVTDSDDIAVVKLLEPGPARPTGAPTEQDSSSWPREIEKLARLAGALSDPALHPVSRKLLQIPVRWHGTDLSPLWDIIADRARSVVVNAERHSASLLDAAAPRVLQRAAISRARDAAFERSLRDHYAGDVVIEAFVVSREADEIVARLVRAGALASRAPAVTDRPTLARLGYRLGEAIHAGRRFFGYKNVFLFSMERAPGEVGTLRFSKRRLRRFLAGTVGSATVERLLRAGRLDGTVERLVRSGSLPRPPVRRGIVPFLLVCVHDANRFLTRSRRMWSASAKAIGRRLTTKIAK